MRTLVTGASGFLGRHLVHALLDRGADEVVACHHERPGPEPDGCAVVRCDLGDRESTLALFRRVRPARVYHLAGFNGGILFNRRLPFAIFEANTRMALNVLSAAVESGCGKVLSAVASCAYPDDPVFESDGPLGRAAFTHDGVLREGLFLDGRPHPSVACHGYAKRNLLLASAFAREQYGLDASCVCPTTLYGEWDEFSADRAKVVGAMVRRFVAAADDGTRAVRCWGTGRERRELLYAPDCARMMVEAMDAWSDGSRPLNLGSGQEVSTAELAALVAQTAGYYGAIEWDGSSHLRGQARKLLSSDLQGEVLRDVRPTPLRTGLARTVAHYRGLQS